MDVSFQTDPSSYRHWRLEIDPPLATLVLDVDEAGGLVEGYALKLNSYDLGVDIELADAVQRLRFEHPEVRAVIVTGGKDRVFCAGANIKMLASSSHPWKVNFCKFTNETRNGIEDATAHSGQTWVAAINGTCAGGGYELALACDVLLLVDDGSTAVALPEVPLLGVLPGTGGLTRLVDKRGVRRDHADVVSTVAEGIKGRRAVAWRLVDEVVPASELLARARAVAQERAATSDRPAGASGVALPPLDRSISDDRITYPHLEIALDREQGVAAFTLHAPTDPQPTDPAGIAAAGAAWWPLALCRALDDAILHLRTNALELGTWTFRTQGDPAAVLAVDAVLAEHAKDWLVREVTLYWQRTLKRLDVTSRSLLAFVEPGSCFAGTLAEVAARGRPQLQAGRHVRGCAGRGARDAAALSDERRAVPHAERADPAGDAVPRRPGGAAGGPRRDRPAAGRPGGARPRPGDVHVRRHRLGGRDAAGDRGAGQPLPGRAHRHGGQPALPGAGDPRDQDLRAPHRLAELDLPTPERGRRGGGAAPLRDRTPRRVRPQEGLMTTIDYTHRIPNNVDLADDRKLTRALEQWMPQFETWWHDLGPQGFETADVYLRTAINTNIHRQSAWGHTKLEDYRWGIFLTDPTPDRRISHGEFKGQPVWQDVPGEFRNPLRRLIVVQGDTEPASVEQQRHLGATAPSLYDLRGLLQVNVEEGRHLWAMVYLLDRYFGRDGRDEAQALLERTSGDADRPRILGAFNEPTPDWLAFFMFTYFTDRDGKYQLASLAESAFDPLSRTCNFMLREEAHHMFIGTTGVERVVQRTCEVIREIGSDDPEKVRAEGAIDLPTLQRYLNFHYTVSLDLFGSELSSNAATYFSAGLKGRFHETDRDDDHVLTGATYPVLTEDGGLRIVEEPALQALNTTLQDDYITDCERGVKKWNRVIERAGLDQPCAFPTARSTATSATSPTCRRTRTAT